MSDTVIKVENLSKLYRLGEVGTGTLSHDFNRWWHKVRGKEDPYLKIGQTNDGSVKGDSDYMWALKDINFEVKRGEVLGIIGRNGAGKSTLLKILSRVTTPTSGEIKVKGRIASLLEVGTGFNPELTGRDNIYLNGAILGMRKREIDRKFDEIVDFSGVERYIDTPVKRYSSGMYVRLAFAVAAHLEPEILIVDEVLAVGDVEFQKKCLGKMQDVSKKERRTVLFVSHNMAAVRQLCEEAIVLKAGSIDYRGSVQGAIQVYLQNSETRKSTSSKYLYDVPRRIATLKNNACFCDVQMSNKQGEPIKEVKFGEIFDLIFTISVKTTILNAVIGFCVKSPESVFLFTTHWDDCGGAKNLLAGTTKTRCKVDPAVLMPGIYSIDLGIVDSDYHPHDFIEDAFSFTVLDIPYSDNIKIDKRPGNLALKLLWEVEK